MSQVFDDSSSPDDIESAISAQLEPVDREVTPFRLRNRYRDGVGTWLVSIAVPAGHECDREALASAAESIGVRIEGYFDYTGDLRAALDDDLGEPPTQNGLPLTNEDQFCAFCDDNAPVWVHPFDPSLTVAILEGRFTLPTFWTICQRCEVLVIEGRDLELVQLLEEHESEPHEQAARLVEMFRAADLGRQPIEHIPTPS
jgi:hypothetical protein